VLAYMIVTWTGYHGIVPIYVETYLLPFHLLFAVLAVVGPLRDLGVRLSLAPLIRGRPTRLFSYFLVAMPLIAIASWTML
jgi:hypothetical protein